MSDLFKWTRAKGPSAGLVQEHFVKRRLAELERIGSEIEKTLQKRIEDFYTSTGRPLKKHQWIDVYQEITDRLQKSELTINFSAASWFTNENTYASYTQMYERAGMHYNPVTKESQTYLKDSLMNPAAIRAQADDAVTFPTHWKGDVQTQRGLRPGTRSGQGLLNQMEFGTPKQVVRPVKLGDMTKTETGIVSDNIRFNAKTKQLFAALNYGRCPNGSAPNYGSSYMVLSDHFKLNAIYFGADTFMVFGQTSPASEQVSYPNLGAIMGTKSAGMVSMYLLQNKRLTKAEASMPTSLLEAHLFTDLPFTGNIKEIVLTEKDPTSDITQNARKFAKKHGARLVFTND